MPFFTWSAEYSVGLREIDQQHKSLVQAVNALHEALNSEQGADDLGWILRFLANYTAEHFGWEEGLMQTYAFPRREEHMLIHKGLMGQVNDFLDRFQSGKEPISENLLDFLKQWLVVHIGQEDQRLSAHIRQCRERETGNSNQGTIAV